MRPGNAGGPDQNGEGLHLKEQGFSFVEAAGSFREKEQSMLNNSKPKGRDQQQ
jgi:hypothetical protein